MHTKNYAFNAHGLNSDVVYTCSFFELIYAVGDGDRRYRKDSGFIS